MRHRFEGIGSASASLVMALVSSAFPQTAFLTKGFLGKIVHWGLSWAFMHLASAGLVILNLGAAKIETIISQAEFDGSWDQAEEMIKKIRDTGRELTDEEIKQIDQPVIDAFRKFGRFGRLRKRRGS